MLAWIFWHTRFPDVPADVYQQNLHAFHERIAAAAPEGFIGSRTLCHVELPWLKAPHEVWEDWYFLRNSAALDALDEAALAALTSEVHNRIARLAWNATAGVYRLRSGSPLPRPVECLWLTKPREVPYEQFISGLTSASAVWSRMMVLGPAPEFCVERAAVDHDPLRRRADFVSSPR